MTTTPTFGVPDPGGPSGTFAALERTQVDGGLHAVTVPFDAIRRVTREGREYWSARELMPLLGYEKWERFADAIDRAKIAAHNSGYDVYQNFPVAGKVAASGPTAKDYHLSRYACYLVAMSGDSRKQQVANALSYFAIKTRQAEVHEATLPAIPKTYAEALRAAADQAERAEAAESKVRELAPAASSWNELADAAGDYSVADAAKILSRDPNITIKERALFAYMAGLEWVFKRDGRWKAMRSQLDTGRLAEKVARPYWHEGRGEMVAGDPTVRIRPKGLQELHRRLGGGEQLALMAGVS